MLKLQTLQNVSSMATESLQTQWTQGVRFELGTVDGIILFMWQITLQNM